MGHREGVSAGNPGICVCGTVYAMNGIQPLQERRRPITAQQVMTTRACLKSLITFAEDEGSCCVEQDDEGTEVEQEDVVPHTSPP